MHIRTKQPKAMAEIRGGKEASGLSGNVWFYQLPGGVLVEASISGLPDNSSGFYGFHIHMGTACEGDFSSVGDHFNPTQQPHPRHAGDLPPLLSRRGRAWCAVITDRFSISDILGRTVVIHSGPDDFHSQPAGNAGRKIACGVIRKRR